MKRKLLYVVLAFCLAFTLGAYANAALQAEDVTIHKGIRIIVDGEELSPTDTDGNRVPVFVLNGTTYLPVRAVSNVFEKRVQWDGINKIVYLGEKPGEKPFMRLKTYYESGAAEADERFVWQDEHMSASGELMKNVVYPSLGEDNGGNDNPAPYGYSPFVENQAGDQEIVLNGQFKRFKAKFFVPKEAADSSYYTYEQASEHDITTNSAEANLVISLYYMNGTTGWKTVFDKGIRAGDSDIDIDLDIQNVEKMEIWMRSGQSHDGTTVEGMLSDPTYYR